MSELMEAVRELVDHRHDGTMNRDLFRTVRAALRTEDAQIVPPAWAVRVAEEITGHDYGSHDPIHTANRIVSVAKLAYYIWQCYKEG